MDIEIIRNDDMVWDNELLCELERNIDVLNINNENFVEQKIIIKQSLEPIPVISLYERDDKENYEILNKDGERLGIVTLHKGFTDNDHEAWEIVIVVFLDFQGNNISKIVLLKLFELYPNRVWKASVYKNNNHYKSIKQRLLDNKFILIETNNELDYFERNCINA